MSNTVQAEIKKAKARGKARVKQTGEVFTPMDLCLQIVRGIPEEKLIDPNSTYLDNSCGDGNFLVALLQVLTQEYGHERDYVVNHQLYGVDLMADNIESHQGLVLVSLSDHPHFVCHDALAYDYSFDG